MQKWNEWKAEFLKNEGLIERKWQSEIPERALIKKASRLYKPNLMAAMARAERCEVHKP